MLYFTLEMTRTTAITKWRLWTMAHLKPEWVEKVQHIETPSPGQNAQAAVLAAFVNVKAGGVPYTVVYSSM